MFNSAHRYMVVSYAVFRDNNEVLLLSIFLTYVKVVFGVGFGSL